MIKAIQTVIVFIAICVQSELVFARVTPEQERLINNLSKNELCSLFAQQLTTGWINSLPNLPPNFHSVFSDCFSPVLCQNYTEKEIREIYIQPFGMDKEYYDNKADSIKSELERCFIKAIK